MGSANGPIFLIMGTPACGKSTVSRALTSRFKLGLHIPADDLRHMVGGLSDEGYAKVLEGVIRVNHPTIEQHPKTGWLVIDSSNLSVEQTVDILLEKTQDKR